MEKSTIDILWIIIASTLVFIMQAGFAMVESGLTRSKNSINVAIKNLTDLGISTLCFWACGFAMMFGASVYGFIGSDNFLFHPVSIWGAVFFLFQVMFCSTSATIVSGAVAERMKYSSYIISTALLSVIIYPIFGHWAWGGFMEGVPSGFLGKLGFIDFAGSTVVHSVGGWVSLAVLLIIGPRSGKFAEDGTSRQINGSNIPITVLGVMILWFGWFGFNGGSTLAMNETVPSIILNTTLAASAGMIGSLMVGWPILKKPDILLVLNGSLAGLVAITASCFAVTEIESVIIGFVGGAIMLAATVILEKLKIDDAVGAIPVHLVAGIWGTIAVAVFGDPAILNTGLGFIGQLKIQLTGIAACGIWSFGVAFSVLFIVNKISPLRVSKEDEHTGLNKTEHGVTTEIFELFSVLEAQSRTGDLSLRAPEEPFTEIGQIAKMYNSVMRKLESGTVEKGEYLNILDNVSDGLILIDRSGTISQYHSASMKNLFSTELIAGKNFKDLLSSRIPENVLAILDEFLEIAFDKKKSFRIVEKMNPIPEIELSFDNLNGGFNVKYFQFIFKRIVKNSEVSRLMIVIRDITRQRELSQEVEENRKRTSVEMELFYRILHVEPASMRDFLTSAETDLSEINSVMSESQTEYYERLNEIFRRIHAVKGDADMLGLDFIAEKAQIMETNVAEALRSESPSNEIFLSLALKLGEIRELLFKIDSLMKKWKTMHTETVEDSRSFLPRALSDLAGRLSERHQKIVSLEFDTSGTDGIPPSLFKYVKDILVQLVRNSVYHGIEKPEERKRLNKKADGKIAIKTQKENGRLIIKYKDDGSGLDSEKIKNTALAKKIITEAETSTLSEKDIYALVFRPDFSTSDSVNKTAGRGVGMSLVKTLITGLKGKIALRSKRGESLEFEIHIPIEAK